MLDMGFIDDVKAIVKQCRPAADPALLATVSPALEEIAKFALREPARIEIGRTSAVTATVNHAIHTVAGGQKFDLLLALLQRPEFKSVLIFSRTKHGADHLAHLLRLANHSVAVLHANRTQPQRAAALAGFKSGKHGIMVATDIAARASTWPASRMSSTTTCRRIRGLCPPHRPHRPGPGGRRRPDARLAEEAARCMRSSNSSSKDRAASARRLRLPRRPAPVIDTSRPGAGQPTPAGGSASYRRPAERRDRPPPEPRIQPAEPRRR